MPYKNAFIVPEKISGLVDDSPVDCHEEKPVQFEDGTLTIPDGNQSFDTCQDMTEIVRVVIPSSLKSIKADAFKGCSGLEEVHISSLSDWCEIEFENEYSNPLFYAKNLYLDGEIVKDLELPSGLKSVGDFAFVNCDGIVSLTIPNGIENFGRDIFLGCTGVKKITYNGSATEWKERNVVVPSKCTVYCTSGILQNKPAETPSPKSAPKTKKSVAQPKPIAQAKPQPKEPYVENGVLIIPKGTTEIEDKAFMNRMDFSSVMIPNSVTSIGKCAFGGCTRLTTVTWNATACTCAGSSCGPIFNGCTALTMVNIGNNVTTIPNYAFFGCTGLTTVYITDIAKWCAISFGGSTANPLYYAHNLYLNDSLVTDLVIPGSVTSIGDYAFYGCTGLINITIPDSVTNIGWSAFSHCSGFTSITIPNSVMSIGNFAFCRCTELTSVTIGSGVTSIGGWAFEYCAQLENIKYSGTKKQWKAIKKGPDWKKYTKHFLDIECTDGVVREW